MERVALIDCNNFYVSCERVFRPELDRVPVLVLSSNDGCVVARSQEVKDIGIPMGVPYFQIKDTIKDNDISVLSGNLALYRDLSRRVFAVVREQYPDMQQYSVDEAFVRITAPDEVDEVTLVTEFAELRSRILREVGIPVSVGIGYSKTQSKCAADIAKKGSGVYVQPAIERRTAYAKLPLAKVWGIGSGLSARYRSAGLTTVADLRAADPARIAQLFGVVGTRMQAELSGIVAYPVTDERPLQQSLMSSKSFPKNITDLAVLQDAGAYHARHIAADLRAMRATAGVVRASLKTSRHGDFFLRGGSLECVLEPVSNDSLTLVRAVTEMLEVLYEPGVPYKKVGVSVGRIASIEVQAPQLFEDESTASTEQSAALMSVIDTLNSSSAQELVTVGSRLRTNEWRGQAAARSDLYTTRWDQIKTVSAR